MSDQDHFDAEIGEIQCAERPDDLDKPAKVGEKDSQSSHTACDPDGQARSYTECDEHTISSRTCSGVANGHGKIRSGGDGYDDPYANKCEKMRKIGHIGFLISTQAHEQRSLRRQVPSSILSISYPTS